MTAIIGGLGAAVLWAAATLCSSRSSRMLGSRLVLGWVMIVGVVVGLPIAIVSPGPATLEPSTVALLGLAGICYVVGLQLTYAALRIGKVSIVAPRSSRPRARSPRSSPSPWATGSGSSPGSCSRSSSAGVVLSTLEPGRTDVAAGDFDLVADTIDGPTSPDPRTPTATGERPIDTRRAGLLAIAAALVFGLGLVAAGKSAALVPVAWVALTARLVGIVAVVIPLVRSSVACT